jgi:phosphoribosylformylglycinamidine synthase
MQGLGGSAYLRVAHGRKTGTPPRVDLDQAVHLHEGLRALIYGGRVKSAHDCSEGGLAVCLAESCFSQQQARETHRFIGAQIDLTAFTEPRQDALLFGETQNRVVISTAAMDAGKLMAQAKALGITAHLLGTVGGETLTLKTSRGTVSAPVAELHDIWWNSIARAMS